MNCTNTPFGMDSLVGSLLERTLSIQTFRLRQDEVKARINKVAERLELLVTSMNVGFAAGQQLPAAPVAGTAYNPAADWEAAGIPLE